MRRTLRNTSCLLVVAIGLCLAPQQAYPKSSDHAPAATKHAEVTVTGKVIDDLGTAVPGVNILVKGSTHGTTSDADGNYTLTVPEGNSILVFSFIGYATQ